MPIPVAEGSRAACLLGLRVRIPLGAWMSVGVVCCQRSLRRAYPSSRGVLPTVVCHWVWSRNVENEAALARVGLFAFHCCHWNATVRFIDCCLTRVAASIVKRTYVVMWGGRHFCQISTMFVFSKQIFKNVASIIFHGNPTRLSRPDRHDECNKRFLRVCERVCWARFAVVTELSSCQTVQDGLTSVTYESCVKEDVVIGQRRDCKVSSGKYFLFLTSSLLSWGLVSGCWVDSWRFLSACRRPSFPLASRRHRFIPHFLHTPSRHVT